MQYNAENILVIGDLHAPFIHKDYLQFCKDVRKAYKTTHTVFIGDVIDAHASSYHEHDPDGYSAGHELREATKQLAAWHKAFPNADVTLGNHCRMAARKIYSSGLSNLWLRDLKDVLQVPTWRFATSVTYHGVTYVHGDKRTTARTASLRSGKSSVQGHRHNESYVWHHSNGLWGMQVGTGIDENAYAMSYAMEHTNVLSCGVVLNKGTKPLILKMQHGRTTSDI